MKNTMTYLGYTANLEFDPCKGILMGRVMDIDDVIVCSGESVAEFRHALHEAVDDYIYACKKIGIAPERPCSTQLILRIDPDVCDAILKAAAHTGESMDKWAERALYQAASS